jgi:LysM repeat protein
MRARLAALALAALALAAPAALRAQTGTPRDTIRLGAPRDTVEMGGDTAARPARNPRWAQPFAVESSGRAEPARATRDVVVLPADSVRARRRAARLAAAAADSEETTVDTLPVTPADTLPADTAPPPARPRRAASGRTARADTAAAAGHRPATSHASRGDTATSATRRTARAVTAAATGRRSTTSRTSRADTTASATRRTARGDTATSSARRSASRADTAGGRRTRTSARDTSTSTRTASRDTATRRPAARPKTHTVAAGETLYGIARRYGVTTAEIRALNPDLDSGLEPGTVLRLPAGARTPGQPPRPAASDDGDGKGDSGDAAPRRAASSGSRASDTHASDTRPPAATRGRRTHVVAAHETLYGIARKYGVTVDALKSANHLSGDAVRVGQTLVIPAAAPSRDQ